METRTTEIRVRSDDGDESTITKIERTRVERYRSEPPARVEMLPECRTASGGAVNLREDGSFEVVATGRVYRPV